MSIVVRVSEAAELEEQKERKRALIFEIIVVLSLTWMGAMLTGLGDFFFPSWIGEIPTWFHFVQMFSLCAMISLPIYLFWNNRESLEKLGFRKVGAESLVLAALLLVLYSLCVRLIPSSVEQFARARTHPRNFFAELTPIVGLQIVHFILAAAREEITQRAYLCTRLRELGASPMLTVTISAAIFTIPHIYQGIGALVPVFLMGLMFAAAFLRYRQIWSLIAAHAAYNIFLYFQYLQYVNLVRR